MIQGILQRAKQMVIWRCKVRQVRWVEQRIQNKPQQILLVIKVACSLALSFWNTMTFQFASSGAFDWLHCSVCPIARSTQMKYSFDSLARAQNAHNLWNPTTLTAWRFLVNVLFGLGLRWFIPLFPRQLPCDFIVPNPFLITSGYTLQKKILFFLLKKRMADVHTLNQMDSFRIRETQVGSLLTNPSFFKWSWTFDWAMCSASKISHVVYCGLTWIIAFISSSSVSNGLLNRDISFTSKSPLMCH